MKRILNILKVVLLAAIFLLPIALSWNVFVALEHRFSPRVPWLVLLDLAFIAVVWSAVAKGGAQRPVFGREPPSALIVGVAASGLLASASLSILLATLSGFGAGSIEQVYASQGITTTRLAFWAMAHAAIVEELALRGILQPVFEEACGLVGALVVTSGVFVLMHVGNDEFSIQWPFYVLLSTVTGYVAWRSKSVALPIATHGLLNWSVNGVLTLHGPIPSAALVNYRVPLLASTLLTGILFAAFVVIDRRRFLALRGGV